MYLFDTMKLTKHEEDIKMIKKSTLKKLRNKLKVTLNVVLLQVTFITVGLFVVLAPEGLLIMLLGGCTLLMFKVIVSTPQTKSKKKVPQKSVTL